MKKAFLIFGLSLFFSGCVNLTVPGEKVCFSDDVEDDCYFFKRGNNVYYGIDLGKGEINYDEKRLKGVDLKTFKPLNMYFAKDDKYIYSCRSWVDNGYLANVKCKKDNAFDINTFENIGFYNYAKDKNNVYYFISGNIKVLLDTDQETFEVLNDWNLNFHQETSVYAKDKNHIYFRGDILNDANPKYFRVLNREYLRDENNCWLEEYEGLKLVDMSECKKIENEKE